MKKLLVALLVMSTLLVVCSKKDDNSSKEINLRDVYTTVVEEGTIELPMPMELSKEDFLLAYGVDGALVEEVVASKAAISAAFCDILMIKTADGKTKDVLNAIEKSYESAMLYPFAMDYVQNKQVIEDGNYLFVIAAENAEGIKAEIEAALK